MEIFFLIGRVLVGAYFISHGYAHIKHKMGVVGYAQARGMNPKIAGPLVLISGVGIILAGIGLILGILTNIALIGMIAFLVAVSVMTHNFWKDTDPTKRAQERLSFEGNLALAAALLMVLPYVSSL